jgi:hypothetical protein
MDSLFSHKDNCLFIPTPHLHHGCVPVAQLDLGTERSS